MHWSHCSRRGVWGLLLGVAMAIMMRRLRLRGPPSPPRVWRNNASNAPMPSMTQDYVHERVKKATFWERTLCCMNIDIRKQQHASYQSNRRIEKLLKEIKEQDEGD